MADDCLIDDEAPDLPKYVPTPEQIAEVCRVIQSEWTPEEERRRRAFKPRVDVDYGSVVRVAMG